MGGGGTRGGGDRNESGMRANQVRPWRNGAKVGHIVGRGAVVEMGVAHSPDPWGRRAGAPAALPSVAP